MLQLLIPVSLDSFEERCQGHLLLPSQTRLLPLDYGLYLLFLAVSFFLFFEIALHVEVLRLFVALGVHQFLYPLPHIHEVFCKRDLQGMLLANLLVQLLYLEQVLLFQFL